MAWQERYMLSVCIHTHSCEIWKTDGAWSCDMWLTAAGRRGVSSACWSSLWLFVSRISVPVWCHPSFISCNTIIICFAKTVQCIYSKFWCKNINVTFCFVVHVHNGVHVCHHAVKTLLHNGLRQRNTPTPQCELCSLNFCNIIRRGQRLTYMCYINSRHMMLKWSECCLRAKVPFLWQIF